MGVKIVIGLLDLPLIEEIMMEKSLGLSHG